MKSYVSLAVVALLSAFIGFSLRPPVVRDPDAAHYQSLKAKLENIGNVDMQEYLRLKDQKARYEKADEILAKILQLMIYDLGLRQEDQLAQMKARKQVEANTPPDQPSQTTWVENPKVRERQKRISEQSSEKPSWKQNTEKIAEIYRADQVDEFLKSVEIPDFFGAIRSGSSLTAAQVEQLNGSFAGRAVFDDPKELPWQVIMSVNATLEEGQMFGQFDVRLSKNGKQFSRTRSGRKRGEKQPIKLDYFMGLEGDANTLIVNAYGDDGYFQLYYFPRLGDFHGLVYLKKSLGVFERKGFVQLTKH